MSAKTSLIRRALLLGGGGAALATSANAKSREEDGDAFNRRTGREAIDPARSDQFRRQMASVAQEVRYTPMMRADAPDAVKRLSGSRELERVQNGEPATLGDYRAVLDAYAALNPQAAASLRADFSRFEPKRDKDVDERPAGAIGATAGALAGLIATRGKGRGATRLVRRALAAGGLAGAGGALGAAAANDTGATLSGDDAGDIAKIGAGAAAVGAAAVGARAGAKRLIRNNVVRAARIAQRTPEIARGTPALDALDIKQSGRDVARKGVKWFESDADILANDILHMERTLDRAKIPRVFTSLDDPKALSRKLRSRSGWDGMQDSLDELEAAYRKALAKMKVKQAGAPSLRADAPEVTDPRDRALIEGGVDKFTAGRDRRSAAARGRKRTNNAKPVSAVKPKGRSR